MNIVFMGTPDFAVPSLQILIDSGFKPILVVSRPDKPRSRGRKPEPTPVKNLAVATGIPTLEPESVKDPVFAEALKAYDIDVMVVVAYRILPPSVFEQAKKGAFNLHASLLPAYRGAAPIHRAVMDGVDETGVTTFFLKKAVDTGDMILQWKIPVGPEDTTGDVHDRLMDLGAKAVLETVRQIAEDRVQLEKQNDAKATPAPKIFREDCQIDWEQAATQVHNHIRGLSPIPCAWSTLHDENLKIYRSRVVPEEGRPGEILEAAGRLVVACGSGAVEILEVQAPGRRRLGVEDYLRGASIGTGDRFVQKRPT